MSTFTLDVEFVNVNCGPTDRGGCGLEFAMTSDFYRQTKRTGETWYCPKGHPRVWGGKTTDQKLQDAEVREAALRDQLETAVRDAENTRAVLLRDRHRFANGVCPCCNRSFENVRRHMVSQHPDYDVTKVQSVAQPEFECGCGRSFRTLGGLHQHQTKQRGPNWYKPTAYAWQAHLTVV